MKQWLTYAGIASLVVMPMAAAGVVLAETTPTADNVVVNPENLNGWSFVDDDPGTGNGYGSFVTGPATPPSGTGSASLSVDSQGREMLQTMDYSGTALSDISSLKYSTFSLSSSTTLAPSFQLDIDYDATDSNTAWQGRLVYEPYQNGTVTPSTWQNWTPTDGKWWASNTTASGNKCAQSDPCTWATVLTDFPNAAIRGGLELKVGGPWSGGYTGNVDQVMVDTATTSTTFDFEPTSSPSPTPSVSPTSTSTPSPTPTGTVTPTPTSTPSVTPTSTPSATPTPTVTPSPSQTPQVLGDCKNNNWQTYTNPSFKNQGQCVKYVVHHEIQWNVWERIQSIIAGLFS